MNTFLSYLALITSLAVAGIAAYFSVIGLATIFAGAYLGVIIMAGTLEFGKLVTAVLLHLRWKDLNYLKYYLVTSVGVLMLITSLGIFGYLSKANIETTLVGDGNNLELSIIDTRLTAQQNNLNRLNARLEGLDLVVETGRPQDRNYINRQQREERSDINNEIDTIVAEIVRLNEDKLPIQRKQLEQESEIGPIKYVAEVIYGQDNANDYLDNATRWVIFALIFVFDPLAVLLLISATGLIANPRPREPKPATVENRYVIQVPKDRVADFRKNK